GRARGAGRRVARAGRGRRCTGRTGNQSRRQSLSLSAPLAGASLGRAGRTQACRVGGWSSLPGHRNGAWGASGGVRPGGRGTTVPLIGPPLLRVPVDAQVRYTAPPS